MISKELLSEVLGDTTNQWNWRYFEGYKNLECTEGTCSGRGENTTGYMSIYEFAHKCKEWALSKGYIVASGLNEEGRWWCDVSEVKIFPAINGTYVQDTEMEAMTEACEWIRTNHAK